MQKWDYKTLLQSRSHKRELKLRTIKRNDTTIGLGNIPIPDMQTATWERITTAWNPSISDMLPQLGEEGWELMAIVPRSRTESSSELGGGSVIYEEELWVFKRPVL